MIAIKKLVLSCILLSAFSATAQEYTAPLQDNAVLQQAAQPATGMQRPTLLTLPFFEDFSNNNVYPVPERWTDHYVFISNTMALQPISEGAATFDGLNEVGVPYDSLIAFNVMNADSLTSQPIDLSSYVASDSLYLSFFYQPKGNGFAPKLSDSFLLFLLQSNGVWQQTWKVAGDSVAHWQQVMIPVKDTGFFHDHFQMRWVNKATMGISNSHWHLDYIRLDANRNMSDSLINDVTMSNASSTLLGDFSAMPYRHFKTDPSSFLATQVTSTLHNNSNTGLSHTVNFEAKLVSNGNVLHTSNASTVSTAYSFNDVSFATYALPDIAEDSRFSIEHKYYSSGSFPDEPKENDTIRQVQHFENYFAYDDGTAEQSYFLNLLPSAPGRTAVEYALYTPDTLRGIAIQFARQVPSGANKEFSIAVFRNIAINGGQDELIYQEDFILPKYSDTAQGFVTYAFEQPQIMDEGIFYIALVQPAGGISDSLYFALDVNRTTGNHRYFDVGTGWASSQIQGALLLRPLVGPALPLTAVNEQERQVFTCTLQPNPTTAQITVTVNDPQATTMNYMVYDMAGKKVLEGNLKSGEVIPTGHLKPGTYIFQLTHKDDKYIQKLVKQ